MMSCSISDKSHLSRCTQIIWLTAIVLAGLLVMSRSKADPDLWGHVQYGKEVIRDGHLHPRVTWSYAVQDYHWINHENVAELILAAADDAAGQTGLLLLKSALALILLGLPLWYAHCRGAGLLTCTAVTCIVAFGVSFHWLIRPHMLSYVCAAGLICLLAVGVPGVVTRRHDNVTGRRWLWSTPALMCFWTNSHGGYLAGMAILVAWLGLDVIDLLVNRDAQFAGTVRNHALLLGACCAGCMLNPYGLELHTWMLSSLGHPRPEISEWAPLSILSIQSLPFWFITLATVVCLTRTDQPRRWPGFVLMGLLAWQALSHHRHLPFLAITSSFVLASHIESVVRQFMKYPAQRTSTRSTMPPGPSCNAVGLTAGCVTVALITTLQFPRQAKLHVDRSFYPVAAMQYMADHQLSGRTLVTFNWAQYALAVFANTDPGSRIAVDGRFRTCYPQPIIDMYFDFILGESPVTGRYREAASGPFDPMRALEYRSPDLVLLDRTRHPKATAVIRSASDWCLLYQDSLAELWGRTSRFGDPSSPNWLPESSRHISDDLQDGSVAWPAYPVRRIRQLHSLISPVTEDTSTS